MNLPIEIDLSQWKTLLMAAMGGAVVALLTGKLVRRLLLLPFEYLSSRTSSKVDDKLVEEARKDLGVDSPTIESTPEQKENK